MKQNFVLLENAYLCVRGISFFYEILDLALKRILFRYLGAKCLYLPVRQKFVLLENAHLRVGRISFIRYR